MAEQVKITITASDQTKQGIQSVEVNLRQMAEKANQSLQQVAVGAGLASAALVAVAKNAIEAYGEMERNLKSLDAVERGFLGTTGALTQKAKELQDQFFGLSATSGSLRNLISGGLGVEEATKLIEVFKDRAILLGNASVPLEQRLLNLTQAFKTEQSELGDASGLTENFSVIVERGSQIVGKNAQEMSKAERAHAKYAAIVEMSAPFIGKAKDVTDGLTGSQAALSTEVTKTQQAIGEALTPAYQSLLRMIIPVVEGSRRWIQEHPNMVMGLTAVATSATAATGAVATLAAGLLALRVASGGIGLLVTAISAAVGALGGMALATKAQQEKQSALNNETTGLMRQYEALRAIIDDNTASTDRKQRATTRLKEVLSRLFELQPQMQAWFDKEGQLLSGATEKWSRYRDAVVNATKAERLAAVADAEKDLSSLRDERAASSDKLRTQFGRQIDAVTQVQKNNNKLAEAEATRRRMEGEVEDKIALENADLDRKIAVKEAQIARDKALLDALNEPMKPEEALPSPPKNVSDTSGSGAKKDPFKDALAYVNHLKAMDQLTIDQEIAMLEEIKRIHASKQEQIWEIDERIHKAREQAADKAKNAEKERVEQSLRLMDHEVRMGQLTTAGEIKRLQEILATHKLTDDQRMQLQERLAQTQERLGKEVADKLHEDMQKAGKSEEDRVKAKVANLNHEQRIGRLSKEEEAKALQVLLTEESAYYQRHADERWAIEERIYSVKDDMRKEDLKKEKEAQEEGVKAAKDARQKVLDVITKAEKDARTAMEARHKAATTAQQREIDQAEDRLKQYDRQIAAEDRLQKIKDAQKRIADLQQSGEREEVILPNGQRVMRIKGMDEAQEALAKAQADDAQARRRMELQDEVEHQRKRLDSLKETQASEVTAHETYWTNVKTATEKGFDTLQETMDGRFSGLAGTLATQLTNLLKPWQTYATEVANIMAGIGGTPTPPNQKPPTTKASPGIVKGNIKAYGTGAYFPGGNPHLGVINDVPEYALPEAFLPDLAGKIAALMDNLRLPTMPAGLGMGGGPITLNLNLPNVTDAQGFTKELPGALRSVGFDVRAFERGMSAGRFVR